MADELVPVQAKSLANQSKPVGGSKPARGTSEPDQAVPELNGPSVAERAGMSAVEQDKKLSDAVARLNEQVQRNGRGLAFSIDERLNREIITVTSTTTGEVVRQIPSESAIKMAHSIEDAKGMLFDRRV